MSTVVRSSQPDTIHTMAFPTKVQGYCKMCRKSVGFVFRDEGLSCERGEQACSCVVKNPSLETIKQKYGVCIGCMRYCLDKVALPHAVGTSS